METSAETTAAPLLGEPLPVELMNTIWADRDGVHDALDDPDAARAWLRAVNSRVDRAPAGVSGWLGESRPAGLAATARELRRLRDALRQLAALATEDPRPHTSLTKRASRVEERDGALAVVNRACSLAPTWSQLYWSLGDQPHLRTHTAGSAGQVIVSMLAGLAVELLAGDGHERLRACLAPGCVLYFMAHPVRREWCSSGCGNRARVARHYQRHRIPPRPGED